LKPLAELFCSLYLLIKARSRFVGGSVAIFGAKHNAQFLFNPLCGATVVSVGHVVLALAKIVVFLLLY
jgi:hypothetical protein